MPSVRRSARHGRVGRQNGPRLTGYVLGVCLFASIGFVAVPAQAVTRFVRTSGSDAADGLSPATALRSIREAAARVQNPGDQVVVGPGEYFEGNIALARSGIAGRPVVLRGDPTGRQTGDPPGPVRIVPQAEDATGFLLLGRSFVEIRDFEIVGGSDAAIQVRDDATGRASAAVGLYGIRAEGSRKRGLDITAGGAVTIVECTVLQTGSTGISVEGRGDNATLTIRDTRVEQSGAHGILITNVAAGELQGNELVANQGAGLAVRGAANLRIAGNTSRSNREEGFALGIEPSVSGGGFVSAVEVTDNRSWSDGKSGINVVGTGQLRIASNQVLEPGAVGIALTGVLGPDPTGVEVWGNEVVSSSNDGVLVTGADRVQVAGNEIRNSAGNAIRVEAASEAVVEANVVRSAAQAGIRIRGNGLATVQDNDLQGGGSVGIVFEASPEPGQGVVRATANRVQNFSAGGLSVTGAETVRLVGNTVTNVPGGDAVSVRGTGRVDVRDCRFDNASGYGVTVGTPEDRSARSVRITGTIIRQVGKGGVRVVASGPVAVEGNQVRGAAGGSGLSVDAVASASVAVRGNTVALAQADGIFLRNAGTGEVRNNQVFSNGQSGIVLRATSDMRVWNNLVYANAAEGIAIGTGGEWSTRSSVAFNTVYANVLRGLRIDGPPTGVIEGGSVLNNIFYRNQGGGIAVSRSATKDYVSGFNVNPDGYASDTRRNRYDIRAAPMFVSPAGRDGVLGGENGADDDFRLQQRRTGHRADSPGVDAGSDDAIRIGLGGTTATDGGPDQDRVDVGYHYGAPLAASVSLPPPWMPIFVRQDGAEGNDGSSPEAARASLRGAVNEAEAGVTVVVGPGVYREGDIRVRNFSGRVTFLADSLGRWTGDPPGPVVIDASGFDTGFVVFNAGPVTIDGFVVTGSQTAGIQLRAGADDSVVSNNVVFSNQRRGIEVFGAHRAWIRNNLVYANGTGGIQLQGTRASTVTNNTVYGNGADGVLVGVSAEGGAAPDTVLERNVVAQNQVQVKVQPNSFEGYVSVYNVVHGPVPFSGSTPRGDTDLIQDPLFVAPAGRDGILGGDGFRDDDFRLQQGAVVSPAVDLDLNSVHSLATGTTASSGIPDLGPADAGFHYPLGFGVSSFASVLFVRAGGDDRLDGRTPATAFATVGRALADSRGPTLIVVAPGSYRMDSLRIATTDSSIGPVVVLGDRTGRLTQTSPGEVRWDFSGGRGLTVAAPLFVDGIDVRNAGTTAVRVLAAASSFTLRNATVCGSGGDGLAIAASRADLINNRICGNAGWGVRVVTRRQGSFARLVNNTIAGNVRGGMWAVDRNRAGGGLRISNNIVARNGQGVFLYAGPGRSIPWGFNLNSDGYSRQAERLPAEVNADPLFAEVTSGISCPGPMGYLLLPGSPAMDAGTGALAELGLWARSTRIDDLPDLGPVDLGYHWLP